ncbi:hypothetical protein AB1I77_28115 [Bacillus paranthracis]|uniref:Uncharacterized protein n=1 Tax=Bacillus cereus (strain AH820) TaxID=405535 RepID=B7JP05_BACC0|nr:hypothetical protein [Bacillus cereus]ACK89150.1 hypothetical protein BCAH820_0574 [Bacillus cereus AH820]ACK89173.1 hypothetical protein BCAH820_4395 [Bacillus cereus AH820]
MKVGIFLLGECVEAYNYEDINDVYEIARIMTEETDLIHEVRVIYG